MAKLCDLGFIAIEPGLWKQTLALAANYQGWLACHGYTVRLVSLAEEGDSETSCVGDDDHNVVYAAHKPYGSPGAIVWVMTYAHAASNSLCKRIQSVEQSCCAMINVDLNFPFLEVVRARAQKNLSAKTIVEMSLSQADHLEEALALPVQAEMETLAKDFHFKASVLALQREVTVVQSRIDLGQVMQKLETDAMRTYADELYKPDGARVFFLTAGMDSRLAYQRTRAYLSTAAETDANRPLAQYALFVLCDAYRKKGWNAAPIYNDIEQYVVCAELHGLKRVARALFAESLSVKVKAQAIMAALLAEFSMPTEQWLCFAICLRIALDTDTEDKQRLIETLSEVLPHLDREEQSIIQAEVFLAVSEAHSKMEDVL